MPPRLIALTPANCVCPALDGDRRPGNFTRQHDVCGSVPTTCRTEHWRAGLSPYAHVAVDDRLARTRTWVWNLTPKETQVVDNTSVMALTSLARDVRCNRAGGYINVKQFINRLVHDDEGQDLIEYALLAGFISLVAVLAITNVGTGVNGVYQSVETQVAAIPGGGS